MKGYLPIAYHPFATRVLDVNVLTTSAIAYANAICV